MKNLLILIISLSIGNAIYAKDILDIPDTYKTESSILPVSYLQSLNIENPNVKLTQERKEKLACLIINAEQYNQNNFQQTYYLEAKSRISQLFIVNFPGFSKSNWKRKNTQDGGTIAISVIAEYLAKKNHCVNL